MKLDVVIKNGKIVDGTGNPWWRGDVGIEGEKIKVIGNLSKADKVQAIDAKGLFVCPGFIDIHTHSDLSFLADPRADSKITQGVTTELVGHCGASAAPLTELGKSFGEKEFEELGIQCNWSTVNEYLERLESSGLPVNVGTLIGHGTIRTNVMGFEARAPTEDELREMKTLMNQGMKEGAFGLSSGLKYAPGVYAETSEVIELCKVVAKYNGLYATHIRNQGNELIDSIEEAIHIGRETSVPVQIVHLKVKGRSNWGKSTHVLHIIRKARDEGLDITYDQYPYDAASTGAFAITPKWAREGGADKFLERLKNSDTRERIEAEIPNMEDWMGPENILVAKFNPDPNLEGKSLLEISKIRKKPPVSVMCDLMLEADSRVPVIMFFGWEQDIKNIMTDPHMMVGSDGSSLRPIGILGKGKPHPRNYGCFPRFLGRYVYKQRLLTIEDAVRRITSLPAARMNLKNRGLIRPEMYADLTILDPAQLIDKATFQNPHKHSEGIIHVLVNGKQAIKDSKFTGELSGKTLRNNF
jgi:N-acyl-D-amino-acid deacylase